MGSRRGGVGDVTGDATGGFEADGTPLTFKVPLRPLEGDEAIPLPLLDGVLGGVPSNDVPQLRQKRESLVFSTPHFGQFIVFLLVG